MDKTKTQGSVQVRISNELAEALDERALEIVRSGGQLITRSKLLDRAVRALIAPNTIAPGCDQVSISADTSADLNHYEYKMLESGACGYTRDQIVTSAVAEMLERDGLKRKGDEPIHAADVLTSMRAANKKASADYLETVKARNMRFATSTQTEEDRAWARSCDDSGFPEDNNY